MSSTEKAKARFVDVVKTYSGSIAVRKLNLDVREGEFLTLLGASGSGKTTSLMMLAGFERPTLGHILLNGERIDSLPPYRRGMGIVFQNYSLFPHMTIAENIAYPLKTRGLSPTEIGDRVKGALDMIRLSGYGGRRPAQLSGGQQQRVALARALVFKPELVLMDEPLGALDKNLREQMQSEISRLHRQLGATIVYVTHDQSEALTMSSRIAVFDQGVVRQIGTPSEIYEAPNCWFVANFVGDNNGLAGKLLEAGDAVATVRLDNGAVVKCRPPAEASTGDPVVVSVRPEHLHFGEKPELRPNALTGTVSEMVYLGDHVRALVTVPGMNPVMVKTHPSPDIRPGSACSLSWAPLDARALVPEVSAKTAQP